MFRVGDRVWSIDYGWGKIVDRCYESGLPLRVLTDIGGDSVYYTEDGRSSFKSINRSLFFCEIDIPTSALNRPKWRANYGGSYWYVESTGAITTWGDHRGSISNDRYNAGNYFKTEKEAMASKIYKAFNEEVE